MSGARVGRTGSLIFVGLMAVAIAILVGLGSWQLYRASWKGDLLAELDAREAAPPLDISVSAASSPDELRYRRLTATGTFDASLLRVHQVQDGMLGYKAVLPLRLPSDDVLLVDIGFVPQSMDAEATVTVPTDPVTLTGFARFHAERPSAFTPDNVADENRWFWWDRAAMVEALGLRATQVLDVSLQAASAIPGVAVAGLAPRPSVSLPRPHDRHAGYAVTWFGLALAVAGALLAWVWQRRRAGQ